MIPKPTANLLALAELRMPFEDHLIQMKPDDDGGFLSYVGHAAVTDRLLDIDPHWSWEPFSVGPNGLPALDSDGLLWIRLTILGVTRIGVGDCGPGRTGGNAAKERIGDAIRNAAMRFGVALQLWYRADETGGLHEHRERDERGDTALPPMPDAKFQAMLPGLLNDIGAGRDPQEIQDTLGVRYTLSEEQIAALTAKSKKGAK